MQHEETPPSPPVPHGMPPRRRWRISIWARLRAYLIAGIIVAAPLAITFVIVRWVIDFFDDLVRQFLPQAYLPENFLPFWLPGIGLLVTMGALILIGMFAAGILGRSVMQFSEQMLNRTPLVRGIYGALKQLFETLLSQSSRSFREVVLVEFPGPGTWSIGFVTGDSRVAQAAGLGSGMVNVFIPMTPNPTSGFLVIVSPDRLTHLEMGVEEAFKLVLSGGIVGPNGTSKA